MALALTAIIGVACGDGDEKEDDEDYEICLVDLQPYGDGSNSGIDTSGDTDTGSDTNSGTNSGTDTN